ncbi:hypothetical protein ED733_008574 [Metarhizium rileyi]|uniref:Uncharacterized protein n=1 Tax=Metarhizium rileyi (strain RCEF 4871) TaxID=1649241 RepID=A0A5C6GKR2_METRR|nr:hypothetical protein ED733_008574 [Metarhizium rileyi]
MDGAAGHSDGRIHTGSMHPSVDIGQSWRRLACSARPLLWLTIARDLTKPI